MLTHGTTLTSLDIKLAIIRHPLVLPPETLVTDVITAMSRDAISCELFWGTDLELNPTATRANLPSHPSRDLQLEAQSSCVLISEGAALIGIFTKRDVVRLIAQQRPLGNLRLRDVMAQQVIALPETEFTDIFAATSLLEKHRIRHLPTIDNDGKITGIITHDSLCQFARPIDLLRIRQTQEVMTKEVVWTTPGATVLEITQLMHQHRVGSVVIATIIPSSELPEVASAPQSTFQPNAVRPLGIITERDLVQFQALGLSIHEYTAAQIMSTPVFTVLPTDHLWTVQQTMTRRMIRRMIVVDQNQHLAGIVTQTSLLRILNPIELYNLAAVLEDKVNELEAEKLKILSQRTEELEREVQERTHKLSQTLEREKIINQAAPRIRNSLDLDEILNTCVNQVRDFLDCDRVIVYECKTNQSGYVIAESVVAPFTAFLGHYIGDNYCQQQLMNELGHEQPFIVNDIHAPEYPAAQVAFFNQYQIKASLTTQIRLDGKIWGLLIAQQCRSSRQWLTEEVQLLETLAIQLSIGIRQSFAYTTMTQQVQELTLWRKRYEAAETSSGQLIYEYNRATDRIIWGASLEKTLGYTSEDAPQNAQAYLALVHPDDLANLLQVTEKYFQHRTSFHYEYRLLHQKGTYIWVEESGQWFDNPSGEPMMMIGMLTDIEQRKLHEQSLKMQRDFNQLIAQITSHFVHVSSEDLDQEINHALASIGAAINADIAYIFRHDLSVASGSMSQAITPEVTHQMTHKWSKEPSAIHSLNQDLAITLGAWCQDLLSCQAVCHIPDINATSEALQEAMQHWQGLHLRGILLIPLLAHHQVIGHIGFGSFTHPVELPQEMINLIVVMGQTIANAQERVSNRRELEILNQHLEAEISRRIDQFREIYSLQQAILNSFDYAITSTDIHGIIRTFNAGAERLLGYNASEVIGKMTPMFFHDSQEINSHAALLSENLGQVIEPNIEILTIKIPEMQTEQEWTNIRKDGTRFLMSMSVMPLKDVNNQTIGFVSIGQDVTEKKRIEEALEKSENRFQRLFDANVVGIMFTDFSGKISDANNYFLNLIGYTREDLNNGIINWSELTPSAHRHKDIQAIRQLRMHRAVAPWEKTYYHKQGHEVPILIGVALLEDQAVTPDDEQGICVCVVVDITEQKRSENRLRETQEFITTIVNTIPLPVFWKDKQASFWVVIYALRKC